MDERRAAGLWGEIFAARYLRERGYDILCSNYRTKFGEIDLVAEGKREIVFVEVKTRTEHMIAPPMEAVTKEKQRKISMTAGAFLAWEKIDLPARFDVIEVYLRQDLTLKDIHHIKNAFQSAV